MNTLLEALPRKFGGVARARGPAEQRSEIGIRIALLNQWRELEKIPDHSSFKLKRRGKKQEPFIIGCIMS
jgi:hypothetical protein